MADLKDPQLAARLANDVLAEFWDETFPIDVEAISETMGIKVLYGRQDNLNKASEAFGIGPAEGNEQGGKISGMIVKPAGKEPVILINREDTLQRIRFTIAHELGHFFEHLAEGDDSEQNRGRIDYVAARIPTINGKPDERDEEIFADNFAHSLLMPVSYLELAWGLGYSDAELAQYFGVSEATMTNRLKNLGLHQSPRSIKG